LAATCSLEESKESVVEVSPESGILAMRKVLFVDDNSDICQVIELMCQSLPEVECICAASMSAVQETAAQVLRTGLAILDVNLGPGKPSGVEVYRWLKGQNYHGRIVFLSGYARTDPLVEEAAKISGVEFFQKPLAIDRIEALILGTT
jgi:DNA-binding NtrC family response regulator